MQVLKSVVRAIVILVSLVPMDCQYCCYRYTQFALSDYIEFWSISFFIIAAVLIIAISSPFSASRLLRNLIRGLLYEFLKQ